MSTRSFLALGRRGGHSEVYSVSHTVVNTVIEPEYYFYSLIRIRRLGTGDSHRNRIDFVVNDTVRAIRT